MWHLGEFWGYKRLHQDKYFGMFQIWLVQKSFEKIPPHHILQQFENTLPQLLHRVL